MIPQKVALIIIGNEILNGKTRDANIQTFALKMQEKGYNLAEVRIIPDEKKEIVKTVNEMRKKYFLVCTSGGIGPTHDDITTESVAQAFNIKAEINEEAKQILTAHYKNLNIELNEARLKMATTPHGASLIFNPISKAPGFKMENVYVLAGIPSIFNAMLEEMLRTLPNGIQFYTYTVFTSKTEGQIATELSRIQQSFFKDVLIGSYPKTKENGQFFVEIVIRSTNLQSALLCRQEVEKII